MSAKLIQKIVLTLAPFVLIACNGGGGGGSDTTSSSQNTSVSNVIAVGESTVGANVDTSVLDFAAYVAQAPAAWRATVGPINNAQASLGKILFYDTRLSSNNLVACATCHTQSAAFADARTNNDTSAGVGGNTSKNSPQLTNVALHPGGRMFWDERAQHLSDQADDPIVDTVEMNETFPALLTELGETTFYEQLFINAFGDNPGNNITQQRIQDAIAEFEKTLLSFNSPFDTGTMTAQQQAGMQAYNQANHQCAECHGVAEAGQHFNMVTNAGSSAVFGGGNGAFPQRIDIGLDQDDVATTSFKTTSLRNVAVTAPFMHSAQLNDLGDVLQFYDQGGATQPIERATTDQRVTNIQLNNNERNQIEAFLNSLTDSSFLTNALFASPFSR